LQHQKQSVEQELNDTLRQLSDNATALHAAQQTATKAQIEADAERDNVQRLKQRVQDLEVTLYTCDKHVC